MNGWPRNFSSGVKPANEVSVFLADLAADVPAEAGAQPAQQEVSP